MKKLKSGYFLSAELGVNVNEFINVGVRVDQMRSNNSAMVEIASENPNEPPQTGILKDDIRISFIGAQMLIRGLSKNQKTGFFYGLSIGYLGYNDNGSLLGEPLILTGSTVGFRMDGGIDFRVHPAIALGINLGFSSGSLNKLELETSTGTITLEAEAGEGESLVRLDIGGGIRFMF